MVKRIFLAWFSANFVLTGIFALITGGWYLRLPALWAMLAEVGLIILPNLIFPILLLRYAWPEPMLNMHQALGWQWNGWRAILSGLIAFGLYQILSTAVVNRTGPSIPYNLPGQGGPIPGLAGILALIFYIIFVAITVAGEETMFRGLIQTQIEQRYGVWIGIILTILLFGLRHLPADIFYAQIWNATPRMWLARQVDLYLGAILLSSARYFGRSTYASATMHVLIFISVLF